MKTITLGALCAALTLAVSTTLHAASISGQGTWETTLQGRDLDGNISDGFEAYYDTSLNITWLADTNYAGTAMQWATANAWAGSLNPYGSGINGWRLPTVTDTGPSGCNFAYTGTDCGFNVNTATSEMAHMFYTTLGDKAYYNTSGIAQAGYGLTNTGPFSNVQSNFYWSTTEYAPSTSYAWYFHFGYGDQEYNGKAFSYFAWAVHAGDVGATVVPVPAAAWLFGSGLLGLVGVVGKHRRLNTRTNSSVLRE
jgi:hypothetical protein